MTAVGDYLLDMSDEELQHLYNDSVDLEMVRATGNERDRRRAVAAAAATTTVAKLNEELRQVQLEFSADELTQLQATYNSMHAL
jgi:hypothetical protein